MADLSRKDQLTKLVMQIVPSQMKHHAEAEACDLLMEVERLDVLEQFVDQVLHFLPCSNT
jgi:26S proteasome regulatory subunit N1